jgi:hypothetical protein
MSLLYHKKSYSPPTRVPFDPANREHLLDYAEYLKYNNWRSGCRFLLEEPYQDIPTMVRRKVVEHFMKSYIDQV